MGFFFFFFPSCVHKSFNQIIYFFSITFLECISLLLAIDYRVICSKVINLFVKYVFFIVHK
jgi:hypothetical protein